jgi:16S rRNA (guanine966-N2)-methyltransferase
MRIVSGAWRGRTLNAPEGLDTRPTTDRVREAIFNILSSQDSFDGCKVLDLFSGSGALGLEALSRGAEFALFVETAPEARGAIRDNVESFSATGITRLFKRDATALGPMPTDKGGPFDLIFLDPPYGKGLGEAALASAKEGGWLAPGARIVFECGADEMPQTPGFTLDDSRRYGETKVLFLSLA